MRGGRPGTTRPPTHPAGSAGVEPLAPVGGDVVHDDVPVVLVPRHDAAPREPAARQLGRDPLGREAPQPTPTGAQAGAARATSPRPSPGRSGTEWAHPWSGNAGAGGRL